MNWRQLYTACGPKQRLELLLEMLRRIEARPAPIVLAGGRLRRERRQAYVAHFIHDRRGRYLTRAVLRLLFLFTLGTVSLSLWLVALRPQGVPPSVGAPLVFAYDLLLIVLLLINPSRIRLALLTRATEK